MKMTVFHAGDGDCLLLSSTDDPPHHILVDGGRKGAFDKDARKLLGKMREDDQKLDVICVSHIDEDHISGILRIMEDEVEWRVHEFRKAQAEADGGAVPPAPRRPRPPSICNLTKHWSPAFGSHTRPHFFRNIHSPVSRPVSTSGGLTATVA